MNSQEKKVEIGGGLLVEAGRSPLYIARADGWSPRAPPAHLWLENLARETSIGGALILQ